MILLALISLQKRHIDLQIMVILLMNAIEEESDFRYVSSFCQSGDPEREQIVKSLEEQYQQKLDDLEELVSSLPANFSFEHKSWKRC